MDRIKLSADLEKDPDDPQKYCLVIRENQQISRFVYLSLNELKNLKEGLDKLLAIR